MSQPTGDTRSALVRAAHLIERLEERLEAAEGLRREPIAIIGMGCRFPGGASSPEAFWELLRQDRDAVRDTPPDRWDIGRYYDSNPEAAGKTYVNAGGFLDDVAGFDRHLFRIPAVEAAAMDPQQRMLLEVSWAALEHAGIAPDSLAGSATGVYVGLMTNDYTRLQAKQLAPADFDAYSGVGTEISFPAGRLSHQLGLAGPSMVISTACSSSLVSLHLACEALRGGECSLALAGGVNLILSPDGSIMLSRMRAVSPDGRCKAFDAAADGYGRGEGCGMVVLKRLSDAQAAGDRIWALVRGSAVNHNGAGGVVTMPSGPAQEALLRKALATARLEPSAISFVEAHGTGTELGDPIEIEALTRVFSGSHNHARPLRIGAVKTNLGHLEAAAGIASVIKVALALDRETIPAHLHFHRPNPHIDWQQAPVQIETKPTAWARGEQPRVAGISSFGLSGVNAHVLLEEAPAVPPALPAAPPDRPLLLRISAATPEALEKLARQYAGVLRTHPAEVSAVCAAAALDRAGLKERVAVVGSNAAELAAALDGIATARQSPRAAAPRVAFLFPPDAPHCDAAARELAELYPVFASALDGTGVAAFQAALVELWASWGIRPAIELSGLPFADAAAVCTHFLELGTAPSLLPVAQAHLGGGDQVFLSCWRDGARPGEELLRAGARLYADGAPIKWHGIYTERPGRRFFSLPTYAFQHQRYWMELPGRQGSKSTAVDRDSLLSRIEQSLLPSAEERVLAPRILDAVLAALNGAPPPKVEDWFHTVSWLPRVRDGMGRASVPAAAAIEPVVRAKLAEMTTKVRTYGQVLEQLKSLATSFVLAALRTLGFRGEAGERMDPEELAGRLGIVTAQRSIFRRCLEMLEEDGLTRREDTGWVVSSGLPRTDPEAECDLLNLAPAHGAAELSMLRHCGRRLADVLTGNCDPVRLLFPGGDQSAVEALYQETLGAREMNGLMRQAAERAAQAVGPGRPLRILEIGGGTAGVTRHILPCLPADRTDYLFTDLSPVFVKHASEKLASFSFLRFAVFDIDSAVEGQPVEPAGYDLIVAANVLHASRDLRASVRRVRHLLAPGGLLLLLEGTAPTRWLDLIFGLTGAWNHFTDRDLRPSYPMIPASQWIRLLEEEGFADPAAIAANSPEFGTLSRQAVLLASRPRDESEMPCGHWLILADGGGLAETLAARVRQAGGVCSLFFRVEGDPSVPPAAAPLDHIVDCWPLDASCSGPDCEGADCRALLQLVQTLLRRDGKHPSVTVITRGAQAVLPGDSVAGFAQAPVWGMLRTIVEEHPELRCRAIDLDPDSPTAEASLLFDELTCSSREREVAFRGTGRLVSRVTRVEGEAGAAAPYFHPFATYLITGGMGGLGLCVAKWMVERGARSLALLGRRPPAGPAVAAIHELRARGSRVECFEADVADSASLRAALERMAATMPTLRGIVHAAGTLNDGLLANLTWDRFFPVLAPKVAGTWNLHRQTETMELDFFVLFSAAAAVFANPSQANHAAANAFLDAFAHWRRAQGKPALAIGWGAWSEIGVASGRSPARRLAQKGMGTIAPSLGLEALSRLWFGKPAQVAVVPIDWLRFLSQAAPSSFYAEIQESRPLPEKRDAGPAAPSGAPDRSAIEKQVHREAARAIGISADEVLDDRTGFVDLGMDSLAAMEFRARLQKLLGCQLPSTLAFDYPTKTALVDHILALLSASPAAAQPAAAGADPDAVAPAILDLSEGEAEAQLVMRLNALNF